jgi:peroxiredoxin
MDAYRDQYATVFNGGEHVTLLAISVDPDTMLAAWAREKNYPFRFLSDSSGAIGRRYGAYNFQYKMDNRTLFVIGPDGRIAAVQAPFREIDPTAYQRLDAVVDSLAPPRRGL